MMSDRKMSARVLPGSPLIFVLCQVRITPVLSMEDKIPSLQDALRKQGFPRHNTRELKGTVRDVNGNVEVETRRQWEFVDKDQRESILIDNDFLVFQVTDYGAFEDYVLKLKRVLEVFEAIVEPSLLQRVGVRYIDLITPSEGASLDDYLSDSLKGLFIKPAETEEAFRMESVTQTSPNSKFIHRFFRASKGYAFPEDLAPLTLRFKRSLDLKTPFGLLDLDHFINVDEEYSWGVLNDLMCFLHERQSEAFVDSVSEFALNEWEG